MTEGAWQETGSRGALRVLVVGAGITGLLAAIRCVRAGHRVVLLDRGPILPAPCFFQFDAYRQRLYQGRLSRGNRSASQRLKRWLMKKKLARLGWKL